MSGHHNLPRWCEFCGIREQMFEHCPARDRMKDLVQITFHTGALARSKNDNSEWSSIIWIHADALATKLLPFPPLRVMSGEMETFPFKIVGFDLDGTLVDTHEDLGAAVNYVLNLIDRPPVAMSEISRLIGGGAAKMLERALDVTGGIPKTGLADLQSQLLLFYAENIAQHSRPYPGTIAMLDALERRDLKLAVVTNKAEHLARKLLAELGLTNRFYTILGGDTLGAGRNKPAPDLLIEMIRQGGGGRAAYVGDTTFDTLAARAAHLPCVAVTFGFNDLPPDQLGADAVIDHFDELIRVLERV